MTFVDLLTLRFLFDLQVIKKMDDEDISKLDPDLIMARQLEELEKERKELQVRY